MIFILRYLIAFPILTDNGRHWTRKLKRNNYVETDKGKLTICCKSTSTTLEKTTKFKVMVRHPKRVK